MTTPIEKFEYLAGLADLSWHDCQDAWFESRQLIPKIAPYLRELEAKATPADTDLESWKARAEINGRKAMEWQDRAERAEAALRGLVKLKNHKAVYGDDESYRNLKPVMWKNAFDAAGVEPVATARPDRSKDG
jgi:hypothetical protein